MNFPHNHSNSLINSISRVITQNIGPLIIAQFIAFGVNFLQLIYLGRTLAPGNFGAINFALTIQFFAFMLTNMGISFMGTRELVIKRAYDPLLFWNITVLRLIVFLGFLTATSLWFILSNPDFSQTVIILIFLFSVIPTILTPDWVFIGLEMMKINSLIRIIIAISGFVLVILLIKSPDDLLLVPVIYLVSAVAGFVIGLTFLKKTTQNWNFQIKPGLWIGYIRSSIKLGISSYLIVAIASIDVLIIGLLLTSTDVGYYSAASKLILAIHTLLSLTVTGIFPVITRTMHRDPHIIKKLSSPVILLILILEIPVCMLISINSDLIIPLFYGNKYAGTIPVLAILIWSIIPVSLCFFYSTILNAIFRESVVLKILTVHMGIILPVMILGTLFFGITGTAGAIVTIGIIIAIIYALLLRSEITFPSKKVLFMMIISIGLLGLYFWMQNYSDDIFSNYVFRILPVILFIISIIGFKIVPTKRVLHLIRDD